MTSPSLRSALPVLLIMLTVLAFTALNSIAWFYTSRSGTGLFWFWVTLGGTSGALVLSLGITLIVRATRK